MRCRCPREEASSAKATQNSARTTADVTAATTRTAVALAAQTRHLLGSNSSWLLIDPEFQSAPANVVPTSIRSPASSTITVGHRRARQVGEVERRPRDEPRELRTRSCASHSSADATPNLSGCCSQSPDLTADARLVDASARPAAGPAPAPHPRPGGCSRRWRRRSTPARPGRRAAAGGRPAASAAGSARPRAASSWRPPLAGPPSVSSAVSSRKKDSRSCRTGTSSSTQRSWRRAAGRCRRPVGRTRPSARRLRGGGEAGVGEHLQRCVGVRDGDPEGRRARSASRSSTVPEASMRPLPMIVAEVHTCCTSARMWELSSTVTPESDRSRMVSRISRMPAGSRPFVGSSRISSDGSLRRVAAMARRCFMPSE